MSSDPDNKPTVPEGWLAKFDDKYKTWFYVDLSTKKSQWEAPLGTTFDSDIKPPAYSPNGSGATPVAAQKTAGSANSGGSRGYGGGPQGYNQGYPPQGYNQGYPQQGYPQQGYPPQGYGYPQQGYPQQGYGGYPPQQQYAQQGRGRFGGMGGGGGSSMMPMAMGLGAGVLGTMAVTSMIDHEEQEAYQDGYQDGMGGDDFGGGDFGGDF